MSDTQDPARLDGWNLRWLEEQKADTERLAALLEPLIDEVYQFAMDAPQAAPLVAARLVAAGVRVEERCGPPCGDCCREHPHWSHWHASDIDPDRLARALHAFPPMCVAGRVLSNKAPHSETDRMLAAAIVKAYEEEG